MGFALAAVIGISLGLLGGGGSILTVPALVYVLGFDAKQAIAMSLAVVGVSSAIGGIWHWRAGNVNARVALIFGTIAMAGTYLGARLSVFFSGAAQLSLFALVMLAAAFMMLREVPPARRPDEAGSMAPLLIAVEGLAVGVLTGLVGVGGGFLVVPALVVLGRLPMKEAVGTSLVVIAMKSAAGLAGYVGHVEVDWPFVAAFTAVAVAGTLAGARLGRFVPQAILRRTFAVLLVVVASVILHQNRSLLLQGAGGFRRG